MVGCGLLSPSLLYNKWSVSSYTLIPSQSPITPHTAAPAPMIISTMGRFQWKLAVNLSATFNSPAPAPHHSSQRTNNNMSEIFWKLGKTPISGPARIIMKPRRCCDDGILWNYNVASSFTIIVIE